MTPVSYDDAVLAVEARLGHKAAKHCKRVAATAAQLAGGYGVDVEAARLAGLLHDWDRETPAETLLATAGNDGLAVSDADAANPHLLHARTGAIAVREAFPSLPADVTQAISRHTLGAPGMTPLDMIVYLADMIEPHRDFEGVERLRDAVGIVSLPELFALGYQRSVRYLVDARKRIHPDTVAVWNALVAGDPS
ncbi:MAG: bis(5'-nucleosyl)-tetraphosphatase (symmetrical) YqeK [Coriobacteriia bacterium]|nr:bis(5'-nucleosyl)-tetraphosphatase (symmetrical) YqeK [Coriobacteriia bacterium]